MIYGTKSIVSLLVVTLVLFPGMVAANTSIPSTEREYIAYLQGVLDALRAQVAATSVASSKVHTTAPEIHAEVVLEATYDVGSASYTYAWFEYGVGQLNRKTTRTREEKDRGEDVVVHRRTIANLETGVTYSYRAVFETKSGTRYYGAVGSFSTFGSGSDISYVAGSSGTVVSTSKGSIGINKTTYAVGEAITVSWTVPKSKTDPSNWIGLFKTTAKNSEYIRWNYIGDDTEGELQFQAPKVGTYELRLFYENSYDDEVTSRRFTVKE